MPWITQPLSEHLSSREGLDRHHLMLIENRQRIARHFLPRTARRLGPRFRTLFLVYGHEHWPPAEAPFFQDAMDFADWLTSTPADDRDLAYLKFLARGKKRLGLIATGKAIHILWRGRNGVKALRFGL